VFAGAVSYAVHSHRSVTAVAYTSFGLTLIIFLTIFGYHTLRRLNFCYYNLKGCDIVNEEELSFNYVRD
jgi:hypothetical protein